MLKKGIEYSFRLNEMIISTKWIVFISKTVYNAYLILTKYVLRFYEICIEILRNMY